MAAGCGDQPLGVHLLPEFVPQGSENFRSGGRGDVLDNDQPAPRLRLLGLRDGVSEVIEQVQRRTRYPVAPSTGDQ